MNIKNRATKKSFRDMNIELISAVLKGNFSGLRIIQLSCPRDAPANEGPGELVGLFR